MKLNLNHRTAISTTVTAIVVIVIILIAAGAAILIAPSLTGKSTTSSTTTSSTTSSTTTSSTNATQVLINNAKAEGSMTIYGLVGQSQMTPLITAFQQAYPWAKVSYVSYASGDLLNKVLAEEKAGAPKADVVQILLAQVSTLENASALQQWCNPELKAMGYAAAFVDPNCYYNPFTGNLALVMYNTNMVKNASTLPQSWAAFANPQYKGQFAIDNPTRLSTAGTIFASLGENETYSQWISFLNAVKANQPLLTSSLGTLYTDVSTGQAAFGIDTTDDAIQGVASGAPIAYYWLNPIYVGYFPYAIEKGDANPYMAELWLTWIASMQGQLATGAIGRLPLLQAAAEQTFYKNITVPIPSGYSYLTQGDAHFFANITGYSTVYTQIFGPVA